MAHIADISARAHKPIKTKKLSIEKKNLYLVIACLIDENFLKNKTIEIQSQIIQKRTPSGIKISKREKLVLLELIIIGKNAITIMTENISKISSIVATHKIACQRFVFVIFRESSIGINMASQTVAKDKPISPEIIQGNQNIRLMRIHNASASLNIIRMDDLTIKLQSFLVFLRSISNQIKNKRKFIARKERILKPS